MWCIVHTLSRGDELFIFNSNRSKLIAEFRQHGGIESADDFKYGMFVVRHCANYSTIDNCGISQSISRLIRVIF